MATTRKNTNLLGVSDNTNEQLSKYNDGYKQSDTVTNAYNNYTNLSNNKPSAYQSNYSTQINDLYDRITNREKFSYDMNADALYQNAKESYQQMGKQAMMDTIGQASALTGGYGNSYATTSGSQAYQQYLTKANDNLPQYYQLALDRYNAEGDALQNQYNMALNADATDYNRYRDTVSDWQTERDNAYNVYSDLYSKDNTQWNNDRSYWTNVAGSENSDYWTNTNYAYQQEQDAIANKLAQDKLDYQKELDARDFAYQKEQDAIANQLARDKYNLSVKEYNDSKKTTTTNDNSDTYDLYSIAYTNDGKSAKYSVMDYMNKLGSELSASKNKGLATYSKEARTIIASLETDVKNGNLTEKNATLIMQKLGLL